MEFRSYEYNENNALFHPNDFLNLHEIFATAEHSFQLYAKYMPLYNAFQPYVVIEIFATIQNSFQPFVMINISEIVATALYNSTIYYNEST